MDRNEKTGGKERARFSLSQETITMVTVGVALAGIILVNQGNMRAEAREDRARSDARMESLRTEARADRARIDARIDATLNAIRAEAREDRAKSDARDALLHAEARADREAFEKQIARLIEQQGTLNGLVEGLEHSIASPGR